MRVVRGDTKKSGKPFRKILGRTYHAMPPKAGELAELRQENSLLKETVGRQEAQILALAGELQQLKIKKEGDVEPQPEPQPVFDSQFKNRLYSIRRRMKEGKLSVYNYTFLKNDVPQTSVQAENLVKLYRETYCPFIQHEVKEDISYADMLEEMRQILKI